MSDPIEVEATPMGVTPMPAVEYRPSDAVLIQAAVVTRDLTINGVDDKEGYAVVHEHRMRLKNYRVGIEKTRKALKDGAVQWGRVVDGEAKRLTALIEPDEARLQNMELAVDEERERQKREAARIRRERAWQRVQDLQKVGVAATTLEVEELTDNEFADLFSAAAIEHDKKVADEKAVADERARLRAEEDALFQAAKKKLDAERAALEAEKRALRAELDAEKQKLADDKAELARLERLRIDEEARNRRDPPDPRPIERIEPAKVLYVVPDDVTTPFPEPPPDQAQRNFELLKTLIPGAPVLDEDAINARAAAEPCLSLEHEAIYSGQPPVEVERAADGKLSFTPDEVWDILNRAHDTIDANAKMMVPDVRPGVIEMCVLAAASGMLLESAKYPPGDNGNRVRDIEQWVQKGREFYMYVHNKLPNHG